MTKAIMIAATHSGAGKTTIVCATLGALKNRGLTTRSFKCGPDYIDPMFHEEITGTPSRNLDLFFTDEATTRSLFLRESFAADAVVVEGVMGLYDGFDFRSNVGSSYHMAKTLNLPVVLIVNARGMGRSTLALVRGFMAMDTDRLIAGVILNCVHKGLYERIKTLLEKEARIKVFGYLPVFPEGGLESRYLGLKLPHEIADLRERANAAALKIAETVDFDALLAAAREIPFSDANPDGRRLAPSVFEKPRARVAVAKDDAFCFYYHDNLRALQEAGAELVYFSPLKDSALPEDVDGVLLGGGYPELHARTLAENRSMRAAIKAAFDAGTPFLAECGGFMYLHDAIVTKDGERFETVGAIHGECRDAGRLVRFGYVELREKRPAFLPADAPAIRGHEFHYFDSDANGSDCVSTKPATGRSWDAGYVDERRWLGFAHLCYLSNPAFPKAFVDKCVQRREERTHG